VKDKAVSFLSVDNDQLYRFRWVLLSWISWRSN